MTKMNANGYLALGTSAFIFLAMIYNFLFNQPIYTMTSFLHNVIIMFSIITLAIHANAIKQNKHLKKAFFTSLVIPIITIIYFFSGIAFYFFI